MMTPEHKTIKKPEYMFIYIIFKLENRFLFSEGARPEFPKNRLAPRLFLQFPQQKPQQESREPVAKQTANTTSKKENHGTTKLVCYSTQAWKMSVT
jgi:hypothetical protein